MNYAKIIMRLPCETRLLPRMESAGYSHSTPLGFL